MSDEQKANENEVFDQELSMGDLDATAGGGFSGMKELFWRQQGLQQSRQLHQP